MRALPDWLQEGGALIRVQTFATYKDALDFVYQAGLAAEENDHHPDITMAYKRVTVRYTTHSAGGITELDFKMARVVESLIDRFSRPPLTN